MRGRRWSTRASIAERSSSSIEQHPWGLLARQRHDDVAITIAGRQQHRSIAVAELEGERFLGVEHFAKVGDETVVERDRRLRPIEGNRQLDARLANFRGAG